MYSETCPVRVFSGESCNELECYCWIRQLVTDRFWFIKIDCNTILLPLHNLAAVYLVDHYLWIELFCRFFYSVQFSSVPLTDWVVGGIWGTIRQRSSSSLFCRRPLWTILSWAGMSTFWCCPSSISSVHHSVTHPPGCPEGSFWRGCCGVWHARNMWVSISWQLPEEVSVDP